MDRDDENYSLMERRMSEYMLKVHMEAKRAGLKLTAFEIEEMEMAFEHGFAHGVVAARYHRRLEDSHQ